MTVTGTVYLDLREVAPDRQRRRVAVLAAVPDGARVVVVVGPLAVQPDAVWLLRGQSHRLHLDIHGEEYAVRRWLDALRTDDILMLGNPA